MSTKMKIQATSFYRAGSLHKTAGHRILLYRKGSLAM